MRSSPTDDAGLVFLAGGASAFRTTDAGASWTPEPDVPGGNVQRLRVVDPVTFYAFGPGTLLRSNDAGQTWQTRAVGASNSITGIGCATVDLCLMTDERGANLLRTENGGDTADAITASTSPLFAAGFANPTRAVAAGAGGATAVSNDGGRNYAPVGGDIAGSFQFGLRPGPTTRSRSRSAPAASSRARPTTAHWKAINVATSADMRDTSFSTADNGYALDQRGGLFRTANGGQSWQPIDPGTTSAPRAVITAGDVVLLAGPRGVRRASSGGEFASSARPARTAAVDHFDRAGSAIFAYGSTAIVRTTNSGRSGPRSRARPADRAARLRCGCATSR